MKKSIVKHLRKVILAWAVAAISAIPLATAAMAATAAEVNLYTDRQEVFLRPMLNQYKKTSGTQVNVLFVKKGLLERMKAEGEASPADVLLLVDAGRLKDFVDAGLTAANNDPILRQLPAALRDANNHWFAVTKRARVLYVSGKTSEVKDYDDLSASGQKVCLRSGLHPYNIAFFADIIGRKGREQARDWLQGVKDNLAHPPRGNDRAQIRGVLNGECDIGVANSYYYFHMLKNADASLEKRLNEEITMVIPQNPHINITGMALAANAPNRKAAKALMRFLISREAQLLYAEENFEFPARDDVPYPPALAPYKDSLISGAPLEDIAKWRNTASEMVDEVGFDRP